MSVSEKEVFEQKRAEADFELVWAKLSQMPFSSLKESYRHAYMQGRGINRPTLGGNNEGTTGEVGKQRDIPGDQT